MITTTRAGTSVATDAPPSILDQILHAHAERHAQVLDERRIALAVGGFEPCEIALRNAGPLGERGLREAALPSPEGEWRLGVEELLRLLETERFLLSGAGSGEPRLDVVGIALGDEAPIIVERQNGGLLALGRGDARAKVLTQPAAPITAGQRGSSIRSLFPLGRVKPTDFR
jgi:hypothetical protein